jgi:hypothetical protein
MKKKLSSSQSSTFPKKSKVGKKSKRKDGETVLFEWADPPEYKSQKSTWALNPDYNNWVKPQDEPIFYNGDEIPIDALDSDFEIIGSIYGENKTRAKGLRLEYAVEYTRHVKYRHGDIFPTFQDFLNAIEERGRVEEISPERYIGNRSDIYSAEDLIPAISWQATYGTFKSGKLLNRMQKRIENNDPMDMPIVLELPSGRWEIMSGNTRFGFAVVNNMPTMKVLVIPVE